MSIVRYHFTIEYFVFTPRLAWVPLRWVLNRRHRRRHRPILLLLRWPMGRVRRSFRPTRLVEQLFRCWSIRERPISISNNNWKIYNPLTDNRAKQQRLNHHRIHLHLQRRSISIPIRCNRIFTARISTNHPSTHLRSMISSNSVIVCFTILSIISYGTQSVSELSSDVSLIDVCV